LRRDGFSLIEILIVVMIMAIVVGVTGSLIGGFIAMFETTEDQTVSRRRAQDVFNVLRIPVQNAGLGLPAAIPAHTMPYGGWSTLNEYYFRANSITANPGSPSVLDWPAPIEVITGPRGSQALRVLYSLPSGSKNGDKEVMDFCEKLNDADKPEAGTRTDMEITVPLSGDLRNPFGVFPGGNDVRAFITFPGINMHPIFVDELESDGITLRVSGKPPFETVDDRSDDIFGRNEIRPYHDLYVVRAGVAYVDNAYNFMFFDVPNTSLDPGGSSGFVFPPASSDLYSGFRVEGIRGVSFDLDPQRRYLTMHVLAEGDIADSTRNTSTAKPADIRAKWTPIIGTLDNEIFYEEYSMTWRMRNIKLNSVP
jgi:prepilin-type N-terminal cleavage/methylation domain-containing protein